VTGETSLATRRASIDSRGSVRQRIVRRKSEYTVGPEVPVLANGPGDVNLLKPGVAVFVIALKHEDGKLTSARLYAEKDGIKPPM
jgi:hypothetical protein